MPDIDTLTTRTWRFTRWLVAALISVVVITGCNADVAGKPKGSSDPYAAAAQRAFETALDDLESRPLMSYTMSFGESGRPTHQAAMVVTRTGAAHGTALVDGDKMELAVLGGKLYVKANRAVWRDLGAPVAQAKRFAGKFVLTAPETVGLDPGGLLTPRTVAQTLREARERATAAQTPGHRFAPAAASTTLPSAPPPPRIDTNPGATTASPVPPEPDVPAAPPYEQPVAKIMLPGGPEVYRIPIGEFAVDVTVEQPHEIVGTDLPIADDGDGSMMPEGTHTEFKRGDLESLEKLFKYLEKALNQVKDAAAMIPQFDLIKKAEPLACAGSQCTQIVQIANTFTADFHTPVSEFEVTLKVTMNGGRLGTQRCVGEGTMPPNGETTVRCTTTFILPPPSRRPQNFPIRSTYTCYALARYHPNTEALYEKLENDFKDMMDELG